MFKKILCLVLSIFFFCGCGATLNPVKRKPIDLHPYAQSVKVVSKSAVVYFKNVISSKRLDETVWDNFQGPFWSLEESRRIGFTQDYRIQSMGVAGVATTVQSSQLVIPFGRVISGKILSAAEQSFARVQACFDQECVDGALVSGQSVDLIIVEIEQFEVWEKPMNHINFDTKILVKQKTSSGLEKAFDVEDQSLNIKIGSMLSSSSTFIAVMQVELNQFSERVTKSIFEQID